VTEIASWYVTLATLRFSEVLPYPHIYGPLNTDAVVQARPFRPGPGGEFSFVPGIVDRCCPYEGGNDPRS
jgi:hypothetical protein